MTEADSLTVIMKSPIDSRPKFEGRLDVGFLGIDSDSGNRRAPPKFEGDGPKQLMPAAGAGANSECGADNQNQAAGTGNSSVNGAA